MEWIEAMNYAINYMEEHLTTKICARDISEQVYLSEFYFQKGFKILTGYTVGEYVRNRRLTLAAYDILKGNESLIDIAYKYQYETPESFSKAFRRFHGINPSQVSNMSYMLKPFQRLIIKIEVEGGNKMNVRVERKDLIKLYGLEKEFNIETSYSEIPIFWDEYFKEDRQELKGTYGVCIDLEKKGIFRYLIADDYLGQELPDRFKIVEVPEMEWAIFECRGPLPTALQTVNTRIWSEWLPGNGTYELAAGINIEKYSEGDINSPDYLSEIWIPVKKK